MRTKITRTGVLTALVVFLIAAVIAVDGTLHLIQQQRIDNLRGLVVSTKEADSKTFSSLLDRYTSLYKQLQSEGITPQQPTPAQVAAGAPGANGINGTNGRSIVDVECQADGEWLIIYDRAPVTETVSGPCVAQNGTNGTNGADSTIPGPPGADGKDGVNGQDGQPPTSWTYTDILGSHTCTRTDPFDPANPTYSCS